MHARDHMSTNSAIPVIEFAPIKGYLFLHDRGGFWIGEEALKYFKVTFNKWTRWALTFMNGRRMIQAYHKADFGF